MNFFNLKSSAIRKVFTAENPDAQLVLGWLLSHCGMFRTSFDSDPLRMAMKEGKRQIALDIIAELNLDTAKIEAAIKKYEDTKLMEI
ncbi:MAG: hypothetical protein C0446_08300 [Chitinophaga sp.]|nr:hypothetical protein [Chitinophaga sp.]